MHISDMGKGALALGPPGLKFTMFLKNNSENGDLCFSARGDELVFRADW